MRSLATSSARRLGAHLALALGLAVSSGACGSAATQDTARTSPPLVDRDFLARHWRTPIAPQGAAPAAWSPLERSLVPDDCGACHPLQFADWKGGIHARSMGAGITGQLVEMSRTDPASARSCPACHAPLAEQSPSIGGLAGPVANPAFDPALRERGVVCAACHVRGHRRFAPPRRDGSVASHAAASSLPHGGVTRNASFLASEFCASCHQFAPDGFRVNGKLVQNTFEEWKASPAARQGLQCQDCHMPDRRHLWRGIHDPDMVKSGVEVDLAVVPRDAVSDARVRATLTVRSVRVGHFFPTYVTPRVVARIELLDGAGHTIEGSVEERAIGRSVSLDLARELADTRIPPGGRFELEYRRPLEGDGVRLRAIVAVFPDHFYTEFFEALLANGAGAGEAQIREALAGTRESPFVLFAREVPLSLRAARSERPARRTR
jgi:cytochrome c554/c'-like protein